MSASNDFLSAGGLDVPVPPDFIGDEGDSKARAFVESAMDSVARIISSMVGADCNLAGISVSQLGPAAVDSMFGPESVLIESAIVLDGTHPVFLVVDQRIMKQAANPMIGRGLTEGMDEPLGDVRLSAAKEVFNQAFGGIAARVGQSARKEATHQLGEAILQDQAIALKAKLPAEPYLARVKMDVEESGTWEIAFVFGGSILKLQDQAPPAPMPEPRAAERPVAQETEKVTYRPAEFEELPDKKISYEARNIEVLLDVPLNITVVLGRSKVPIKQVLEYGQGSLITLDKLAGEPVDLLINGKYFAKGEVVVIDENFGVRISSILSPEERLHQLTST
ncbi:MAG: flagellar motor switch protein FliN [bacterium]|jgi:flagellar motor switch protein FliN/FliY